MPKIEVRPAVVDDVHAFVNLRHDYMTSHVWQMDHVVEDANVVISFREMRLPRPVEVYYPDYNLLKADNWIYNGNCLTGIHNGRIVGYTRLFNHTTANTVLMKDLVVDDKLRRKGIGSVLVLAAQEWAVQRKYRWMLMQMQSKNYPAIKLAGKLGFEFCGFNDHYYANQDIALFFAKYLR